MWSEQLLEVGIAIGEILHARETKLYMRKKHMERFAHAKQSLAQALRDYNTFGMYDDCGPSYEADYERARGHCEEAQQNLSLYISFEKHLKKLKHAFKEKYPEYLDALEQAWNAQTEQIQAANRGHNV